MMKKIEELHDPDSTWNRTADDEPVFILCGRDSLAPAAVRFWINAARDARVPAEKLRNARRLYDRMTHWQASHSTKLPD